jgi:predicted NBD/HSP70 family sugar kinase
MRLTMPNQDPPMGPALLRRINEQKLLEHLQAHGPASRARLRRMSGLTAPTVSKVVETLIQRGLVEELESLPSGVGRPGKLLRLARNSAVVLGVLLDPGRCTVTLAGIDGRIDASQTRTFPTPASYQGLLSSMETACREILARVSGVPQGVAVVVNGLINDAEQRVICCANLHVLDGQDPAGDLGARLGLKCRILKGTAALCLSERTAARMEERDDLAVLDMTTGLGLGAISNGVLITGHGGLGGEIGHVVVDPDGAVCGCGNRGCLETLATDAAVIRLLSKRVGLDLDRDAARRLLVDRPREFSKVIDSVAHHLAMAAAMVVTILNPRRLLIHSELFLDVAGTLEAVSERLAHLGLHASVAGCALGRTKTSKEQAAVAGIIHEITRNWLPGDAPG